jgi:hypothetical protein
MQRSSYHKRVDFRLRLRYGHQGRINCAVLQLLQQFCIGAEHKLHLERWTPQLDVDDDTGHCVGRQ